MKTPIKTPAFSGRGFTLVELLVVLVIVAALAAIAFTLPARMKQSANQAVTAANLRQIGVAMVTYTADKGRFPGKNGDPVWDRAIIANLGFESPTVSVVEATLSKTWAARRKFSVPPSMFSTRTDTSRRSPTA